MPQKQINAPVASDVSNTDQAHFNGDRDPRPDRFSLRL
jgi:hypothetical protein